MSETYSIDQINQMGQDEFVAALGEVFENTPSIAQQAWKQRPFASLTELHNKMVGVVESFSPDEQLTLLCAHPDLGAKTKMADSSVQEQAGVGLDRLTAEEFDRFQMLNQAYKAKFGFPFIVAVKNHTKDSILQSFEQRLQHSAEVERQNALEEIFQITRFRLNKIVN